MPYLVDAEGKIVGHVLIPRGHYIGQIRGFGRRNWRTVTGRCRTDKGAMARAVKAMKREDHRARVLFIDLKGQLRLELYRSRK